MSGFFSTLRLEVLAVHSAGWNATAIDQFRNGMARVVERVEASLRAEHPRVQLQARCVTPEQAYPIRNGDFICAAAVLDVSQCNDRLALLAGRLLGSRVPCIVVCHADAEAGARRLGVNNPDIVTYASIDDLFLPDSVLQRELLRAVPESRIHEELIYHFWFPRETSTVWLVCPQIHNPGEFADRLSPDYTYLDNLGDTDALLEVMVFLSQFYPNATIERFSAVDLPAGHTSGNLVVIGGPGSPSDISNEICREMMNVVRSHVAYSEDCEQMMVTREDGQKVELRAQYRMALPGSERQGIRKDLGYFARFPNPLNEHATAVLINGIHTTGVLGAAKAFGERLEALRNFQAVLVSRAQPSSFECHFDVHVLNGHVKVPTVAPENVWPLERPDRIAASTAATMPSSAVDRELRTTLTILFIAGDRGGTQLNQLQIPNEYDAIQVALRACKHRDLISLANPILAVTRAKLAEAYRQRPAIIHFAGHGDDRSLSIIENRDVLANETLLSADQLCDLLRTMEKRVRLCVLNACASVELAQRLVQAQTVDCAIGWPAKVSDSVAIAFSRALYGALGDGRTIAEAVDIAIVASGPESKPVLAAVDRVDMRLLATGEDEKL